MTIRRPSRIGLLKICGVVCISLVVTRIFLQLTSTEDYERTITSSLFKIEREKAKYPNESYYVVANLIQPRLHTDTRGNNDIVLCTQTSLNNIHSVLGLARKWDGFISVAVFSYGSEISLTLYSIILLQKCSNNVRRKIFFHLVYPIAIPPRNLSAIYKMDLNCGHIEMLRQNFARENYAIENISYPVNLLRSVAMLNSKSKFVLNLDIDFYPSKGMKKEMESYLGSRNRIEKQKKIAYVIPGFESNTTFYDPLSKEDLFSAMKTATVRQFTLKKCPTCNSPTNYTRWLSLDYPSKMNASYYVKFHYPWEPFYIADRKRMPLFDPRFKQYGLNRYSQLCEAYYSGYEFAVMNNAFVIHDGFKDRKTYYKWKHADNIRNYHLFNKAFKKDLRVKYRGTKRNC